MYEHRLKDNQINKVNYKVKDYMKNLSIKEIVELNIAIKENKQEKKVHDYLQLKLYHEELKKLSLTNLDFDYDKYNKLRTELFDQIFEIKDTGFIKTIVIR